MTARRRPLQALAASSLAALAVLALLAGCGSPHQATPEAVYEQYARLNEAGEFDRIWDLMTDEARRSWIKGVDQYREYLRINYDPNEKPYQRFECTREEFLTLPYTELFRRSQQKSRRMLVDAKVVDSRPDPATPGDHLLTIDTAVGWRVHMRTRKVADGWAFQDMRTEPK